MLKTPVPQQTKDETSMKTHRHLLSNIVMHSGLISLAVFVSTNGAAAVDATKSRQNSEAASLTDRFDLAEKSKNQSNGDDELDSANSAETSKSWTVEHPQYWNDGFLNSLKWVNYKAGNYTLSTGIIYGKWVAAMKWIRNGKVVLVEYTPPYEYVVAVNPVTGQSAKQFEAVDANHDGVLEMAFLHEKLDDKKYHMYTVYALERNLPKLVWKSGGTLGDWVAKSNPSRPAKAFAKSHAEQHD